MSDFFKHTFPIHSSNSFNYLAQKCIENIRLEPSSSKTYLAYPSNEVKDFFIQSFIKKNSYLFGIRFITLQQYIHLILKICYRKDLPFPSHYELMFFLEEEITHLLDSKQETTTPLIEYVDGKKERIVSLASNLSHIFLDYMLYGKEVLPSWLQKPSWQQALYQKVTTKWVSIIDAIEGCPHPPFPLSLHLFTIDTIPKLYLQFFEKLSPHMQFTFYQFSPSPLFWGDLISQKKSAYLDKLFQKKKTTLEKRIEFAAFSKESHPLLSHFCDGGKELYNYLSEQDPEEEYTDVEITSDLTYVQKTLLYQVKPQTPPFKDKTLTIHSCPSLFREIEVLLTNIITALQENPSLHPSDITVLAPDIDLYFPFIAYHFSDNTLPFAYTISNLRTSRHNHSLATLELLFSLIDSRFEKEDIVKLFSAKNFRRRCQVAGEETELLKKILQHTGIRWGFDISSKDEILENKESCSFGLFSKGFSHIIHLLTEKDSPIDFSSAEGIGDVITIIENLHRDITLFKEKDRPLSEWLAQTIRFAEKYLYSDEEGEFFFKEIKKITSLATTSTFLYSYQSFKRLLNEVFAKKGAWEKTYEKPQITFSSIESSPPVGKALFFLGLDAESFPKKDTLRSLNELQSEPGYETKLSPAKKGRFYLLRAICSAKPLISFSFTSNNPADGRVRTFSPILEEMSHALSLSPPTVHPFAPFDPFYFSTPTSLEKHYHLYLSSKERKEPPFAFSKPATLNPKERVLKYKELALLARSPSAFFYNLSTNLYENKYLTPTSMDDSEFVLSYLDKAIITKRKAVEDDPKFLDLVETNKLPTALFGTAAASELEGSIEKEKRTLRHYFHNIDPYLSLHLDRHILSPITKGKTTFLPAISARLHQTTYIIEGPIPNLTEKGILSFKKSTPAEIWKHLPALILLSHLDTSIPPCLLFVNEGRKRVFSSEKLRSLLPPLLSYYEKALKTISPLVPEAVEEYLKDKTVVFAKIKSKLLARFGDPYLEKGAPADYLHFEKELSPLAAILEEEDEDL